MVIDLFLHFLKDYGLMALSLGSFASNFFIFPVFIEISSLIFLSLDFSPVSIFLSLLLGSVLGGLLSYYIGHFGLKMTSKYGKRTKDMEKLIERWGSLSVFFVSFLPVPFPFSLFAILVGFLKMNVKDFFLALVAGKSLRIGLSIFIFTFGIEFLKSYHLI